MDGKLLLIEADLCDVRKIPQTDSPLLQKLYGMIGLEDVKTAVRGLVQLAKHNKEAVKNGEAVFETSLHRLFLGNPGTGKTTVAKLYGKLLCEPGLLSNGEVVVMDASELTGAHEGATEQKVNDLLHSATGSW